LSARRGNVPDLTKAEREKIRAWCLRMTSLELNRSPHHDVAILILRLLTDYEKKTTP
jgi:hypothetical protein